jgi:ankyrin repeat protein
MTWTLLHDACEHDDTKHIIQLAHTHAEDALTKESHGMTPMHVLLYGHPTVSAVTALLEACPQAASDCDLNGDTPLHLACCGPSKEIVELLLDACPTAISMQNNEGLMPLHMACRYNPQNEEIIRLLVDKYPFALLSHIKVCLNN